MAPSLLRAVRLSFIAPDKVVTPCTNTKQSDTSSTAKKTAPPTTLFDSFFCSFFWLFWSVGSKLSKTRGRIGRTDVKRASFQRPLNW